MRLLLGITSDRLRLVRFLPSLRILSSGSILSWRWGLPWSKRLSLGNFRRTCCHWALDRRSLRLRSHWRRSRRFSCSGSQLLKRRIVKDVKIVIIVIIIIAGILQTTRL
jgi:hypothetical protein